MIDYLDAARGLRTQNEFNRLHIRLEQDLAPVELASIAGLSAAPDFPDAGRAWLDQLCDKDAELFEAPAPFERRSVVADANLYVGSGDARRNLLIGFTGVAMRLMLPAAMVLQAIDAKRWDVLILKRRRSFLDGVDGLSDTLEGLIARLKQDFQLDRYASVATIGTSGGGGVAAVAAIRLGAARGLSICGAMDETLARMCPRRGFSLFGPRTELRFVHGADCATDREGAVAMKGYWGGKIMPVQGVRMHNVLFALQKRGELKPFLRSLL